MFSEISYHVWRLSMAFKENGQCYGNIHGIFFFRWYNILHKFASWNEKKCCLRKFSFSLHEISFSIFRVPKMSLFCEEPTKYFVAKLDQIIFLNIKPYLIYNWPNGWVSKSFDPPLMKKINFHRFNRKRVKFELQRPHSLLFIFFKKYF